jgi:hypothetical protein
MKIAILCPGPSLREYLAAPVRHDVTIAVNQAVRAGLCDWWVFGDPEAYWKSQTARHGAKCFTSRQSRDRVSHSGPWANQSLPVEGVLNAAAFEEIGTPVPWETNWHRHSMTAAMVLAASSPTASQRASISGRWSEGRSNQFLSRRAPNEVMQWSRAASRVASRGPPNAGSSSSRLPCKNRL